MNQQISTSQFSYRDGIFSAFASDFSSGSLKQVFKPINPPAQLKGFYLVSHKTGKKIAIVLDKAVFDKEGDLTHWEFQTLECDAIAKLIIWND